MKSTSLCDCGPLNTLEGKKSPWSKGPDINPSPLVPAGDNPTQPGNLLSLEVSPFTSLHDKDTTLIWSHPQPAPNSHPFLRAIRPLASSGIYSPPRSQPLVTLPNHSPLSPIPHISGSAENIFTPDRVFISPEPVDRRNPKPDIRVDVRQWVEAVTPEQEWDTFNPIPTFQNHQEFWNSRGLLPLVSDSQNNLQFDKSHQIQIVSTDLSESNSSGSLTCINKEMSSSATTEMEAVYAKIKTNQSKIKYLIERLTEADVDEESVKDGLIKERLKEIRDLEVSVGTCAFEFIDKHGSELGDERCKSLKDNLAELSSLVKAHEKKIRAQIKLIEPPKNLSSYESEMLDMQRKLVEIEMQKQNNDSLQRIQEEKRGKAEVTGKVSDFRNKVRRLEELIKLVEMRDDPDFWVNVESEIISQTMKDLKSWDSELAAVEKVYIEVDNLIKVYGEPENAATTGYNFAHIKSLMDDLRIDLKNAKDAVIKEDTDRALFSLESTKGEVLKYPTFSGDPSQDYIKFKDKMDYRFRRNRVAKQDQLEKLREVLKGQALRLVPESTKDVDSAWSILKNAFGDATRVLQYRLDLLHDLGNLPADVTEKGACNMRHKVEFLIKLENVVKEIIDLGNSDEDLMMLAFNGKTVASIVNKFPNHQILKLNKVTGRGKQRLVDIHLKIIEFRSEAQDLEKTKSLVSNSRPAQHRDRVSSRRSADNHDKSSSHISYNPPKRDSECRICCHMKDVLNACPMQNTVFFENHLSNYATGCPQFIAMDMAERFKIVQEIKMCNRCFHPDVNFTKDHIKDCTAKSGKGLYTCSKCKLHSWLCKYHKAENQQKLDKFKKDYREKFKLKLVFTANIPAAPEVVELPPSVADTSSDSESLQSPTATSQNVCNNKSLNAATKSIKKRLRSNGFRGDIRPVPEGESMFLFFRAKGKINGVNTFFDMGCSTAVYREGVPGTELRGRIIKKGPFIMNGVGGIQTKANDMWLCSLDLADGGKQLVQGLSVNTVTMDFPLINLDDAVREVKADSPDNALLQSCKVPTLAGGCTDLLLGIMYAAIHPVLIHQLPCGLAIYKSALASHGDFDCLIGGPHKSFDVYAGHVGGASQLLAHFVQGLNEYRTYGAPKLEYMPCSYEEEMFAKQLNSVEGDMPEFKASLELDRLDDLVDNETGDLVTVNGVYDLPVINLSCDCKELPYCCFNLSSMLDKFEHSPDDKLRTLKNLLFAQDGGLSIEYRCVKCRECWQCKNADETEKLSIREEQENYLIKQSVKLDFENKSILCTLPGRGPEREFLTSNKDLAIKVYHSVCKRYHADTKSKELILSSFQKLFDKGFIQFTSELSQEERDLFEFKDVHYFIPWRPVFSNSVTTPCRPTFDASSRTRKRPDGSGGRCLNDYVVKGSVSSLNLLRLVLRWQVGSFAMSGDLAQFYNRCKLATDQWNLQKFVWSKDLDPNGEILECVVKTLIYGVKSVSAQSEFALEELANSVSQSDPELAEFLRWCRYVDDLGSSETSKSRCLDISKRADQLFAKVGLEVKGWSFTGQDPSAAVSKDGISIGVAGMRWIPKLDALEVKIPALHFGKKVRGKLNENTPMFSGDFADLETFVPQNLNRRQIASKLASVFDPFGKFAPIIVGLKSDLRKVVLATESWDESVGNELRSKWLQNFWKLEQLRGIHYHRPIMPENAVNTKMRIITGIDAALDAIMVGSWGCFELSDGSWSCKLIIGRGILAPSDGTIPKNELDALTGGSNLNWVVTRSLDNWVEESLIVGDSVIALSWVTTETKRLSMFHRNRVIAVRRNTQLTQLYHVVSSENPADVGTRPTKVRLDDVGPNSAWENGLGWMRGSIQEGVEKEILKPALELRLNRELEDEFNKGLMFESQIPEILTRGHAVNQSRLSLLEERSKFSKYLMLPTKYSFPKVVRIYSIICCFVSKARKNRKLVGALLQESGLMFSSFFTHPESGLISYFTKWMPTDDIQKNLFVSLHVDRSMEPVETEKYVNMALLYLFRKASMEVREFNSAGFIKKHTVEKDGILLSKSRMVAGLDFAYTGELNIDLGSLGLKVNAPVIDRYSPLAYSVAQHVHWDLSPHRGMETHNRVSLEHVHIIQGMSLYKELSLECIRCNMRRKKFMEAKMGGIQPEQLTVAPPFWTCQIDLFGPYRIYVPGYERETRNRKMLDCHVWILAIVCPTSRLVNLQVVEKTDASGIICGFTRLACEVGLPKFVFCDQDSSIMAAFRSANITLRDVELKLYEEKEIVFKTCPVGGHHQNGQVERVIRSIQQGLDDCGLQQQRLHATGLQTLCKCVENSYNSVPIGYSYSRDVDNTNLLKVITPNMLRMGRTNQRQLDGPIRLAKGSRELLDKVEALYKAWFLVWRDSVVPKIMFRPKWYDSSQDLEKDDLVYFQKEDKELGNPWLVGMVEQVVRSDRDGIIRRVVVKYRNKDENHDRFTDRTVHKLVKLFSIDEFHIQEDLGVLQKRIDELRNNSHTPRIDPPRIDQGIDDIYDIDNQIGDDNAIAQPNDANDSCAQDNSSQDLGTQDDQILLEAPEDDPMVDAPEDAPLLEAQEDGPVVNAPEDRPLQNDGPSANTRSKKRRCNCCCEAHCVMQIHSLSFDPVFELPVFSPCSFEVLVNCYDTDEKIEEDDVSSVLLSLDLVMV